MCDGVLKRLYILLSCNLFDSIFAIVIMEWLMRVEEGEKEDKETQVFSGFCTQRSNSW